MQRGKGLGVVEEVGEVQEVGEVEEVEEVEEVGEVEEVAVGRCRGERAWAWWKK